MDRRERIGDDEETLRTSFDSQLANLWTALPAIVTSVDFGKMTISAQLAIKASVSNQTGDTTTTSLPMLVDVPICIPNAGGFALTLPVQKGDEVLIVFGSRCIDGWWQSGGTQEQMEFRMHDLSDGFAIVGISSVPNVIPNISATNAQLRTKDGGTFIEITPSGAVNITAPEALSITSPNVTMSGTLTVQGVIVSNEDVISGGISGKSHTHSGVTSGTESTGVPQ